MTVHDKNAPRITFTTDHDTLEKIKKMQLATSTFNRSEMIRKLVDFAIESKTDM